MLTGPREAALELAPPTLVNAARRNTPQPGWQAAIVGARSTNWFDSFATSVQATLDRLCGVEVTVYGSHTAWFGLPGTISVGSSGVSVSGGPFTFGRSPEYTSATESGRNATCTPPTVAMVVRGGVSGTTGSAGPGETLTLPAGTMHVTFQDQGSSVADGTIASREWLLNGVPITVASAGGTALSAGRHQITLRITSDVGLMAEATVTVIVPPHTPLAEPLPCDGLSVDDCADNGPGGVGGATPSFRTGGISSINGVTAPPGSAPSTGFYWVCTVIDWYSRWTIAGQTTNWVYTNTKVRDCDFVATRP